MTDYICMYVMPIAEATRDEEKFCYTHGYPVNISYIICEEEEEKYFINVILLLHQPNIL